MEKNIENVFDNYANYLTDCIADIKFLDKENLREYLKTHLKLFYSECLDDHVLPDIDKRNNALIEENKRLVLARVEMEEQILLAKSALREKKYVDTSWLARLNYAFRMKGVQIMNNNTELKKISIILRSIETAKTAEREKTRDKEKLRQIKREFINRFGENSYMQFMHSLDDMEPIIK